MSPGCLTYSQSKSDKSLVHKAGEADWVFYEDCPDQPAWIGCVEHDSSTTPSVFALVMPDALLQAADSPLTMSRYQDRLSVGQDLGDNTVDLLAGVDVKCIQCNEHTNKCCLQDTCAVQGNNQHLVVC